MKAAQLLAVDFAVGKRVGLLEIGVGTFLVVGDHHAAGRHGRVAAAFRELLKDHDLGAGVESRNGRRRAGTAVADDGDVGLDIPLGGNIGLLGMGGAHDRQRGGNSRTLEEIAFGDVGHLQDSLMSKGSGVPQLMQLDARGDMQGRPRSRLQNSVYHWQASSVRSMRAYPCASAGKMKVV